MVYISEEIDCAIVKSTLFRLEGEIKNLEQRAKENPYASLLFSGITKTSVFYNFSVDRFISLLEEFKRIQKNKEVKIYEDFYLLKDCHNLENVMVKYISYKHLWNLNITKLDLEIQKRTKGRIIKKEISNYLRSHYYSAKPSILARTRSTINIEELVGENILWKINYDFFNAINGKRAIVIIGENIPDIPDIPPN